MFEEAVDALFALIDLDRSNGLCETEFRDFIKSFVDCIDKDSLYF